MIWKSTLFTATKVARDLVRVAGKVVRLPREAIRVRSTKEARTAIRTTGAVDSRRVGGRANLQKVNLGASRRPRVNRKVVRIKKAGRCRRLLKATAVAVESGDTGIGTAGPLKARFRMSMNNGMSKAGGRMISRPTRPLLRPRRGRSKRKAGAQVSTRTFSMKRMGGSLQWMNCLASSWLSPILPTRPVA